MANRWMQSHIFGLDVYDSCHICGHSVEKKYGACFEQLYYITRKLVLNLFRYLLTYFCVTTFICNCNVIFMNGVVNFKKKNISRPVRHCMS